MEPEGERLARVPQQRANGADRKTQRERGVLHTRFVDLDQEIQGPKPRHGDGQRAAELSREAAAEEKEGADERIHLGNQPRQAHLRRVIQLLVSGCVPQVAGTESLRKILPAVHDDDTRAFVGFLNDDGRVIPQSKQTPRINRISLGIKMIVSLQRRQENYYC